MSDPKIRAGLVELTAGERVFCARILRAALPAASPQSGLCKRSCPGTGTDLVRDSDGAAKLRASVYTLKPMDYMKPAEVVKSMVAAGATKGALPVKDLLVHQ